jgi:4-hydroxy-tetrahydrodipicolinate reductase
MRIVVAGATGKLGSVVCRGIQDADDLTLVGRCAPSLVDAGYGAYRSVEEALAAVRPDTLVETTTPETVARHVRAAITNNVNCVIATTGLDTATQQALGGEAKERGVRLFYAPNFAIGAVLMMRLAAQAARTIPDAEIIEQHAITKRDAPSGTAIHTAGMIEQAGGRRPPIHSIRLPGLVAHQEIVFGAAGQTLTIRHDTTSRDAFIPGVLLALRRLPALAPGLTVGLETLL